MAWPPRSATGVPGICRLSLRDVCDVAHAVLAGRVQAQTLADRTAFGAAALRAGDDKTPWPDLDTALSRLDELLAAEPKPESQFEALRRELRGA